jgi:hypothetical protein
VPTLTIDLIWSSERQSPGVQRLLEAAEQLAADRGWL